MRIAFAGNPNSGKTTMYNALTGVKTNVLVTGPGLRSARKESPIKAELCRFQQEELVAVDLPGAYSMSPFTPEEGITSGYVRDETSGCDHQHRRCYKPESGACSSRHSFWNWGSR